MASDALYDAVLGALTLLQVTRGSFSYNQQAVPGFQSGMLDVSEYFGGRAEPRARFSSTDVGGVLAGISATAGLAVSSGTISIPFQKRSNKATFAGSTSHDKVTAANGLIIPVSASASQDGDASIDLECIFQSTDGTNPITISTGQSLGGLSFNKMWTLGPASVNSQTIEEVQSITVNFGIGLLIRAHNGMNFPDKVYIQTRRPSIDITFTDFAELQGFSAQHTVMTAAAAYFRQRSGATFAANNSTTHCKFSFTDGIVETQVLEASNEQDGTATLRLLGETLTVSGASAIT